MSLVPRFTLGDLELSDYPFGVLFGGDIGSPQNVAEIVDSMLEDGEIVSSRRSGNRTMKFSVLVEESDMQALAAAETALLLEADKSRNTFAIDPGDGYGAETVFDVFRVQVEFIRDDDRENAGFRRYDLTMAALPFGRSATEVVTDALSSGATPSSTTISDGTSATNWTGTSTVTASGGFLQQTVSTFDTGFNPDGAYYSSTAEWTYTPGSPLDFSAEAYLSVDLDPPGVPGSSAFFLDTPKVYADGVQQVSVAIDQPSSSVYRLTFAVSDTSVAVLKISATLRTFTTLGTIPTTAVHKIDNVKKSNQAPGVSDTGRESVRRVEVKGSARTAASLAIEHESTALGDTLVYTAPSLSDSAVGYQPPMRRWQSAGPTGTPTSTSISGTVSNLTNSVLGGATFNIPASALPAGTFVLMGRLRMSSSSDRTGTLSWTAGTRVSGSLYGSKSFTSPSLSLLKSSSSFTTVVLGMMTLPMVDVPVGSSGTVEVGPFTWSGSDDVNFDEMWLFGLGEDAALSWVQAGTTFQRLWLDPASVTNPVPSVWLGVASDRSDAIHGGGLAVPWAQHSFRPPWMNVFVATATAVNPSVKLRHFPRWHSHAEDVD